MCSRRSSSWGRLLLIYTVALDTDSAVPTLGEIFKLFIFTRMLLFCVALGRNLYKAVSILFLCQLDQQLLPLQTEKN